MSNRQMMYDAAVAHAKGHIEKHKANVEIYFNQSVGIGEHSDIMETIEKELNMIAQYHDQLEVLEKYFKDTTI
tara:strand:- start:347 stop:565 length:219 start_codon:yes stop_codon:yes gene_type:complete